MKLSVVIANWNGLTFLESCLKSLGGQSEPDFEVIVVDNGSDDGSVEFIKREYSFVSLIENKKNLGFAVANNLGIKAARGEYIITMNNDTRAESGFLSSMLRAAQESGREIGMWAPKILCVEEPDRIDSVGGLLLYPDGIGRGRGRQETDRGQYDYLEDILFPSACTGMYRHSMLVDVGGFDESFFAYCEDTDLGLRCRLSGWGAKSVPEAVVYHHYSATTGKYSPRKAYLVERNRQWVVIKNFPLENMLLSPIFTLWRFMVQGYGVFFQKGTAYKMVSETGKVGIIKNLFCAYKDAMFGFSRVFSERAAIAKRRKISYSSLKSVMAGSRVTAAELVLKE